MERDEPKKRSKDFSPVITDDWDLESFGSTAEPAPNIAAESSSIDQQSHQQFKMPPLAQKDWEQSQWLDHHRHDYFVATNKEFKPKFSVEDKVCEFCLTDWINANFSKSNNNDSGKKTCSYCSGFGNIELAKSGFVQAYGADENKIYLHPRCWAAWHNDLRKKGIEVMKNYKIVQG